MVTAVVKREKKGFTLAELLIVAAIIGVLVAISIPIFSSQLKKARLAANQANAKDAKNMVLTEYMNGNIKYGQYCYIVSYGRLIRYDANNGIYADSNYTLSWPEHDLQILTAPKLLNDISSWTVRSPKWIASDTYEVWDVTINGQGEIIRLQANNLSRTGKENVEKYFSTH
jgi:prepilin-type N-terminal cleavage/methylation domain-containing protein